jgi:hypothetical protein
LYDVLVTEEGTVYAFREISDTDCGAVELQRLLDFGEWESEKRSRTAVKE